MTERTVKLGEYNCLFLSNTAIFFPSKNKRDDFEENDAFSHDYNSSQNYVIHRYQVREEEKTSLVEAKNIKSGEVVVGFNGKDEKAKVVVLSGKCTLSLL